MSKFSDRVKRLLAGVENEQLYPPDCHEVMVASSLLAKCNALEKRVEYLERTLTTLLERRAIDAVESIKKKCKENPEHED